MSQCDSRHTKRSKYLGPRSANIKWIYNTGETANINRPVISADGSICFTSAKSLYSVTASGSLRWKLEFIDKPTVPAVDCRGIIYCGCLDGIFSAINPNGTIAWTYDAGEALRSAPQIRDDGAICFSSGIGNVYLLNPDGALLWMFDVGYSGQSYNTAFPALTGDGNVYTAAPDGNIHCIDSTGTLVWTYGASTFINSSPVIGTGGDIYSVIGLEVDQLIALNKFGELKWTFQHGALIAGLAIAADGTLLLGGNKDELTALDPQGNVKWTYGAGWWLNVPLVAADGSIYVGSYGTIIHAIDAEGSPLWSCEQGDFWALGLALAADGTLYAACQQGKLYAFGYSSP
jgi:outer membrane protein assembly factor BamB